MDLRLVARTFVAIFVAELGDKTQLATLALTAAGGPRSKLAVFVGSAGALVATSLIAVLVGDSLARVVPPDYITRGAGVLFVAMGAWMLWRG